jgi:ABC-type glycerol-3-phosphate transport system permease component
MNTQRPAVVTIAAILLIVLSLFVAGLGIASQFGLSGAGFGNRQFVPGQLRNRNFTPQNGVPFNGGPITGFPNDQNNQGTTPNFTPNQQFGTGFARLFRLIRPVMIGLDVILLVLAVVAAFGLFKSRRWGATLAIVLAVLLFLLAIPGLLRIFSAVTLIENLVRMLLAVAVIVLLLLPSARKAYLPVHENQ